jgi:ankyrin repeat protein
MRERRGGWIGWIALLLLMALAGCTVWSIYADRKQHRLNAALMTAVMKDDTASVQTLLQAGADPNTHLKPDPPRSIWSVWRDQFRGQHPAPNPSDTALLVALDSLIERPKNATDDQGIPLENATLVKALLDRGANVNAQNKIGATPLMLAASWNYTATFNLLIAHKADPNIAEGGDMTPLMQAAIYGNTEEAEALLDRGANPDTQDILGQTALMWASKIDLQEGVVRALLKHHANVHLKDRNGQTALAMAQQWQEAYIIRMLKQAGAQPYRPVSRGGRLKSLD